ncbi:Hsp20/alpha crystallin family protein [Ancylostoma duodenale]|uniref:Hsp20/alpha crystallin family protein n=1 Tax=Ancylostoma duodenale TaxID=51022 RepID=A0A0C2CGU5_9BILA|nr:Hsp20/alpha crystallin family protein [Ancylostoma duodenale]
MSLCALPTAMIFPRLRFYDDLFDELDHFERALRPLQRFPRDEMYGLSDKVTNDDSKLAISLEVPQFKPEELKVSLDGRTLKIEGKQELNEDGAYSMRCFTRHWVLPEEVDVEQIRSSLTDDGHLAIEAPKISKPDTTTRDIPIQKSLKGKESS